MMHFVVEINTSLVDSSIPDKIKCHMCEVIIRMYGV